MALLSERGVGGKSGTLPTPTRDGVVVMSLVSPHGGVMSSNCRILIMHLDRLLPTNFIVHKTQPPPFTQIYSIEVT